jgi:hypothetical protein
MVGSGLVINLNVKILFITLNSYHTNILIVYSSSKPRNNVVGFLEV